MTRKSKIAKLRAELERLEAEEKASRPALAAGQVWKHQLTREHYIVTGYADGSGSCDLHCVEDGVVYSVNGGFNGDDDQFEYAGLARDVLRVVEPGRAVRADDPELNALKELEALYRGTSRESREMNAVLRRLDAISAGSVVEPEAPADPEPTGAALVGMRCWVRDADTEPWRGPRTLTGYDPEKHKKYPYLDGPDGERGFWAHAKPYREGVAP